MVQGRCRFRPLIYVHVCVKGDLFINVSNVYDGQTLSSFSPNIIHIHTYIYTYPLIHTYMYIYIINIYIDGGRGRNRIPRTGVGSVVIENTDPAPLS
jgi:hypothetical protein